MRSRTASRGGRASSGSIRQRQPPSACDNSRPAAAAVAALLLVTAAISFLGSRYISVLGWLHRPALGRSLSARIVWHDSEAMAPIVLPASYRDFCTEPNAQLEPTQEVAHWLESHSPDLVNAWPGDRQAALEASVACTWVMQRTRRVRLPPVHLCGECVTSLWFLRMHP